MEEETRVLMPDETTRPIAFVSFDFDMTPKTIILDKSNLIIVKSHGPGMYIHKSL